MTEFSDEFIIEQAKVQNPGYDSYKLSRDDKGNRRAIICRRGRNGRDKKELDIMDVWTTYCKSTKSAT